MTSFASPLGHARVLVIGHPDSGAGRLLDSRQRHAGMTSFASPLRHVRVPCNRASGFSAGRLSGFPPEARGNDVVHVAAPSCPSVFIGHPDSAQAGFWIPARGTRE